MTAPVFAFGRKPFRRANKLSRATGKDPVRAYPLERAEISIPEGFVPHDGAEYFGLWQVDYLKRQGLTPGQSFLDIGCGDLRAGVPLIRYLEPGNYVGVDQTEIAIQQGLLSLTEADLARAPRFFVGGDMGFDVIGQSFDVIWAHSVWTHVDLS